MEPLPPPPPLPASRIAALVDHTLLRADAGPRDVERLCAEATAAGFFAVCVAPSWVEPARGLLARSAVRVVSVAAFPLGTALPELKAEEARRLFAIGAHEVDVVIHVGRLKAGDVGYVRGELEGVARARPPGGVLKAILETAALADAQKVAAARAARDAGFDFVKTSTGFGPGGATEADVALLRRTVGEALGVKASGGIRDLAALEGLVAAGATRIGTSAGVAILEAARRRSRS